jgi:hypothetical protein
MRQGPHRLARGQTFFARGRDLAAELGVPFGWDLKLAPGVAHDQAAMAGYAAPIIFG